MQPAELSSATKPRPSGSATSWQLGVEFLCLTPQVACTMAPAMRSTFNRIALSTLALCAAVAISSCTAYAPAPLEGAERQQAFADYIAVLNQKVAETWTPLVGARDYPNAVFAAGKLTTVVWAVIDQHGDLVITDLVKSAHPALDREAIRALSMATPLPSPPEGLMYRSSRGLVAGVPVQFSVNVPGEPGTLTQGRFLAQGQKTVGISPVEVSLDL